MVAENHYPTTDELTGYQKEKIEELRSRTKDILAKYPEYDTDFSLLRWLLGWDYNIDQIVPKLKYAVETLVNLGMHKQPTKSCDEINEMIRNLSNAAEYFPGGIMSQSKRGDVVILQTIAKTHPRTLVKAGAVSEIFRLCITETEMTFKIVRETEKKTKSKLGVIIIMDLDGFSMDLLYTPTLKVYMNLLTMLQNIFPDFARKIFVINCPMMMSTIYAAISPVLSTQTREKIKFLDKEWKQTLIDEIGENNVYTAWGGKKPMNREKGFIRIGGKVHEDLWYNESHRLEEGKTKLTVPARSRSEVKIRGEAGKKFSWLWRVNGGDLDFSIEKDGRVVWPVFRIMTDYHPEIGTFDIEEDGEFMKLVVVLLLSLVARAAAKNVFVSSPFDNFRIECPKRATATEISIRMVESVGQKRQDIVFDMSCETVEDLYPWVNIPVGIADIEREDCHYSDMIDPILDENTTYTCAPREYLAGITRLSDTRIQTMCCRLRSRDEFNCKELVFNKPIGLTRSTVLEHDNQLINAIRISGRNYVVRFCDLAPRGTTDIIADERIRSTTPSAPTTESNTLDNVEAPLPQPIQQKTDPLKVLKTHKPSKAESVPTAHVEKPIMPLVEIEDSQNVMDISGSATLAPVENQPPTRQPAVVPLPTVPVSQTEEPVLEEAVTETMSVQETTFPQETPIFSQKLVEDIVRQIGSAQSEQKAAQIFQQSLNKLIQKSQPEPPVEIPSETERQTELVAGPPSARPPIRTQNNPDFSKVTFPNEQFPQPNQHRPAFSKELLPIRKDLDQEEFERLQPVNMEGRRRSPIRTHRQHVDIWSSEEDDEETKKIINEINGSEEMKEPVTTTTEAPKVIVKKVIKKVIRAHRTTTTTEAPMTTRRRRTRPTTTKTTTTEAPRTRRPRVKTTKKYESAFFSSIEDMDNDHFRVTSAPMIKMAGRTTTPSARRDLPVQRKLVETRTNQQDNARDIDEETRLSPFDDPVTDENAYATAPTVNPPKKTESSSPMIEFQEDEELEEVINKLSARRGDIRRAPVRNSIAAAQFAEKISLPSENDGVKTHVPRNGSPIKMPEMEPISMSNLDDLMNDENDDDDDDDTMDITAQRTQKPMTASTTEKQERSDEELDNVIPTNSRPLTTTTAYNPNVFYRTPRPRPAKKESILRFCSKELAIRDQSNMVIACGIDQEIWTPSRCPENADCFMSHDSLYRICCPVQRG
ncbi:unnamed protein product [Caenorhabditis bovis]|uniref:CRAL-TRIO domain-containing protein n=1 Tax=Caenorhabditis bovis TaxID=2654633 RepID=A0A8S1EDL3_9PELO|nr:unnamed protein product [Caenorhabditis bovis]